MVIFKKTYAWHNLLDLLKGGRLNKSIYGLKQASRQWYLKFDQVVTSNGFIENKLDDCIYLKFNGAKFIILVLYGDDILLASSYTQLLKETKSVLNSK